MSLHIVVVGIGGFSREVFDVAAACARHLDGYQIVGAVDDSPTSKNLSLLRRRHIDYLGDLHSWLRAPRSSGATHYSIAIGDPEVRKNIADMCDAAGLEAAVLVHPSATIGSETALERGSVVCAGALVSSGVTVGQHGHINSGAILGHDATLGDYVSVNPGAVISGNVAIGDGALIGANATVLQNLLVGTHATVGAGACVTRDVPPEAVAVGVPARWSRP